MATFSCFRFTPGLTFGEKDIDHPAITEYLSLTGQGKLQNRKIISEKGSPVLGDHNTGIKNYSSIVNFLQKKYNTCIKSYSSIVNNTVRK